jgi:hypothetical protein
MATEKPPALPVYYMKLLRANVDARHGKMSEGDIVPMDEGMATRYLTAGVAVQVAEGEFKDRQARKEQKASAAEKAFRAMNDGHAMWDVATYRDVLTAPESGLRQARKAGIPLVNVHMLRDEDGDTLAPDADIEDIIDARANLHADLVAPFAAHDRSSVMGGGSPYSSNLYNPAPLSPAHRAQMERVADQERRAQLPADFSYDRNDPDAKRRRADNNPDGSERSSRAERRAAPKTPVSPQADKAAADAGVKPPTGDIREQQKA